MFKKIAVALIGLGCSTAVFWLRRNNLSILVLSTASKALMMPTGILVWSLVWLDISSMIFSPLKAV